MSGLAKFAQREFGIGEKLWHFSWGLLVLLTLIAAVGIALLYSAADGSITPWAARQAARFVVGVLLLGIIALVDPRFWFRWAYVGYGGALGLLVLVELMGAIGMGAQRWIDLGIIQLQPSEIMKVAVVVALARYFHGVTPETAGNPFILTPPLLMVLMPVALVAKQPDLGTAVVLLAAGGAIFFLGGVRLWMFGVVIGAGAAAVPMVWGLLHDYQRRRVLTFLDPESDPLGAGYHTLQAKIALGSGGISGKGFLMGTQSHLNFIPEKQTDFIFTILAEEFGLIGSLTLLGLYLLVIAYGMVIALRSRNQFGRLLGLGLVTTFFLYVFINVGMVMGLLPIVGVPLPLISYGGTSMLTILAGFGLIIGVSINRNLILNKQGETVG
ncbi:MAG: rod shape-determining protein RodA [Alphaproteobacteria bacterium]|nr:rod shape-determining protein RodA [Alphaproteobacteria bacterium]